MDIWVSLEVPCHCSNIAISMVQVIIQVKMAISQIVSTHWLASCLVSFVVSLSMY
jgi:hypothetical protein